MLTYKRKLILSESQTNRLNNWLGVCRMVYNLGLEVKIAAYKTKGQSIHKYELMKQLTSIRQIDWVGDVPCNVLQNVIERLDNSYKKFFKGSGFPKWANKKRFNSISFKYASLRDGCVALPKIGKLKFFKDAEIEGNIRTATITKEITGYYICLDTDATKNIQNKDESQVIGLDVGIASLFVDSNGNFTDNPKHFKKYEKKLRIENRSLSRKKKGGNNWKKQAKKLSLLHHKIANVRRDFLHKQSTTLAKTYNTVILEDLNISAMSRNKSLSKHILDCGWGIFKAFLQYKTAVISVDAKYSSQTCFICKTVDSRNRLTQSEFKCISCGHTANADENAAKNILGRGTAILRKREALA